MENAQSVLSQKTILQNGLPRYMLGEEFRPTDALVVSNVAVPITIRNIILPTAGFERYALRQDLLAIFSLEGELVLITSAVREHLADIILFPNFFPGYDLYPGVYSYLRAEYAGDDRFNWPTCQKLLRYTLATSIRVAAVVLDPEEQEDLLQAHEMRRVQQERIAQAQREAQEALTLG